MSTMPISLARVSNLLTTDLMQNSINTDQTQLLNVENELSTGLQINQPSDNPAASSTIEVLQKSLARNQTYNDNINTASSQLGETDSTLGSLTTLLQQAQTIASQNVGSDVSAAQRQNAATVVQSLYNQAVAIGNTQFNNMYIFGGQDAQTAPFVATNGGVQFVGTSATLQNTVDPGTLVSYQANGAQVFGSLATGVTGTANISPELTMQTRLSDVSGASNQGVRPGSITISDGTVTKTVNLSSAQSIGDVVNMINAAGVGSIQASISGQGITLSGTSGENISVQDSGGTMAADLGIATASGGEGAGNPDVGASVNPKVTDLTQMSDLLDGSGVEGTGIIIANGSASKTITWSPTDTVQDVLNDINGAGLGVQAQINAAGTGINILNATQGTAMTVGENGGNSATELGIRSYSPTTLLSSMNNGQGVQIAGGSTPDFQVTTANGTQFDVSLGSATTVNDVIQAINTASGGSVTASFATTGNGIVLTDNTTGGGSLAVSPLNDSTAAQQLGLLNDPSGNVINGGDVNGIQGTGTFNDLLSLINGLQTSNQQMITAAGSGLQNDINQSIQSRGQVGALEQQLTSQQTQLTQENTATQSLISSLQDANVADTASEFQTLQTSYQASLETTAQSLNLSLFDFLS
jgi:flagellar hook-associated protein 3 FlgL